MLVSQMFPSRWLSSADIEGHTPTVIIRAITVETVGAPPKDEEKYVMWFEGKQKGLILNKTNGVATGQLHGNNTDNWMGKQIQLYVARVRAFGAIHDAIRIRSAGTVSAAPLPVHDAEPDDIHIDMDDVDEIPFDDDGEAPMITDDQRAIMEELGVELYEDEWEMKRHAIAQAISGNPSPEALTLDQADKFIGGMLKKKEAVEAEVEAAFA